MNELEKLEEKAAAAYSLAEKAYYAYNKASLSLRLAYDKACKEHTLAEDELMNYKMDNKL